MIVSLALYNERLAAVFETADHFALYQVQGESARLLGTVPVAARSAESMAAQLAEHCVSCVVCGALCGCDHRMLAAAGMEVVPWICGTTEDVISALCRDDLASLTMPGCADACPGPLMPREGRRGQGRKRRLGPGCSAAPRPPGNEPE